MSTDDQMDALLRDAGSRWRAATPVTPPTPEFDITWTAPRRGRSRWALPAAAAAAVVVIAGGGTWLGTRGHHSGGGTEAAGVPSTLTGIVWHVDGVTLHQGSTAVDVQQNGTSAYLSFADNGTFTGDDGVNSLSGSVQVGAGTMHFGDVAVSAVGTTDSQLGRQAAGIDSIVSGDVTWHVVPGSGSDHLVIDHAGVGEMDLVGSRSGAAPGSGTLVGVDWKIFEVTKETGTSASSVNVDGSPASLHIAADGSFTANDGCNTLSGTVTITATTMTFGAVSSTEIGCPISSAAQNAIIDEVLQGSVTWSVRDAGGANDLSIEHAGVGSLIYFGAKPSAPPVVDPAKINGTWVLTQYEQTQGNSGSGGAASGGGAAGSPSGLGDTLVVESDGTFKIQHRCYADSGKVAVGSGTATWSDVRLDGAIPCPSIADQKEEQMLDALVDGVLSGSTTWNVDGGQLTIVKGGDSLGFSAYGSISDGVGRGSASPGIVTGSPTN